MPPALREQISALSPDEKLALYLELGDELDDAPMPDDVAAELDRREAAETADPQPGWTVEQIRAALRDGHGR